MPKPPAFASLPSHCRELENFIETVGEELLNEGVSTEALEKMESILNHRLWMEFLDTGTSDTFKTIKDLGKCRELVAELLDRSELKAS